MKRKKSRRRRRSDDEQDVLMQIFASTFFEKKRMTHFIFCFDQEMGSTMKDVFKRQQKKVSNLT